MSGRPITTAHNISDWSFQETYIERLMDDASFTSAHPNNTLVLAGPARRPQSASRASIAESCLPLGFVTGFGVSSSKPLQPMQVLGSGRTFFLTGKGQISLNISRLVVNGRNLLRALYTNAVQANLDVTKFGDPPISFGNTNIKDKTFLNLDSELFYVPFGMAVIYRSVTQDTIGAFYIELCMLNSWNLSIQPGGNMIMESVSGMADRIVPLSTEDLGAASGEFVPSSTIIDNVMYNSNTRVGDEADLLKK